jgi:hypothetical protein
VFAGTVYGKREPFYAAVRDIVARVETPDHGFSTEYDTFIATARRMLAGMGDDSTRARTSSAEHAEHLQLMLEREFALLLKTLRRGRIVVNLPSYTRGVVHRVPEAIAAGRVVLTNRFSDRPKTMEWLEANPGVFLYDSADELRQGVTSLAAQPELVRQRARDAADFARRSGGAEAWLGEALSWIEGTSAQVKQRISLTSSERLMRGSAES